MEEDDDMINYDPESYWSRVGQEIKNRGYESYLAGDDNPYLRHKRNKFIKLFLNTIDFQSKVVLEIGCGPGGNLLHIARCHFPMKLIGVDISQTMIEIAKDNMARYNVVAELHKIDGMSLPFSEQAIDVSFTVTVLQHITDEAMLKSLIQEICRVTKTTIVLMESTGNGGLSRSGTSTVRDVDMYKAIFFEHGFKLFDYLYLNTRISRLWNYIVSQRLLSKEHKEGEYIGLIPQILVASFLPITRILDGLFVEKQELTKMVFHRRP
jgi:ubiquinone/menaquinone biosynthesis C-methylase UbiE